MEEGAEGICLLWMATSVDRRAWSVEPAPENVELVNVTLGSVVLRDALRLFRYLDNILKFKIALIISIFVKTEQ